MTPHNIPSMLRLPPIPLPTPYEIGSKGKNGNDGQRYGVMMHDDTAMTHSKKVRLICKNLVGSEFLSTLGNKSTLLLFRIC